MAEAAGTGESSVGLAECSVVGLVVEMGERPSKRWGDQERPGAPKLKGRSAAHLPQRNGGACVMKGSLVGWWGPQPNCYGPRRREGEIAAAGMYLILFRTPPMRYPAGVVKQWPRSIYRDVCYKH